MTSYETLEAALALPLIFLIIVGLLVLIIISNIRR